LKYKEFREDALAQLQSLPYETNELYKKYSLSIELPSEQELHKPTSESYTFINNVEKGIHTDFDVVISCDMVRSNSKIVKIIGMDELDKNLKNKLYKSNESKFVAFSNAHSSKALLIESNGKKENIKILFVNNGNLLMQTFVNTHDSDLNITEFYLSNSKQHSIMSSLHEFDVNNSTIEINQIHNENENTTLLNLSKGVVNDNSTLNINSIYNGSTVTKSLSEFISNGSKSCARLNELAYGISEQKFDLTTSITNSKQNSSAFLDSGVILDNNSYCALKGYAKIDKWTKNAKSKITERGILLSKDAHIDALPDMSIDYSDGVSATHSAATAPLDNDALFYMESRGVGENDARKMFISAFISKHLSNINDPFARELSSSIMLNKLEYGYFGKPSEMTTKGVWSTEKGE
jgi:Fe-S cluster assembly scaffold protein SufB